jgi:hypothetical protein
MVPVEIVADGAMRRGASVGSMRAGSVERSGPFRVWLAAGLRIEVEPGFDAAELRRLITALDSVPLRNGMRPPV